jgi:hypothetical protein
MSLNTLSGPDSRDLSVPRSGGKDPGIGLILSDPVRFSRVLPRYPNGRVCIVYLPVLPLYGFVRLLLIRFTYFIYYHTLNFRFYYPLGV